MPRGEQNGGPYDVDCSGVIARALERVQERASLAGRGKQALLAIRQIWQRLRNDPTHFGEPLYRLPALRLQIRSAVVAPIVVHFGVSEDRPLVFIQGMELLGKGDS